MRDWRLMNCGGEGDGETTTDPEEVEPGTIKPES